MQTLHAREVIEMAIGHIGSRTLLAVHLEISTSTLDKMRQDDTPIPCKHCVELSRLTNLPLHRINPDCFDPDVWILSPEEIELVLELRSEEMDDYVETDDDT